MGLNFYYAMIFNFLRVLAISTAVTRLLFFKKKITFVQYPVYCTVLFSLDS
ncbi:MAG: hypothetical protein RL172_80 [Bacteroidota bacterium]